MAPEPVTAVAPGLVVRSARGILVLDLDGDGDERTGWNVFHLHVSNRLPVGSLVNVRQVLGYPSCEGGRSTGTHLHFARKYNGEWIPAWGVIPFNLEGWIVQKGNAPYEGYLYNHGYRVVASPYGKDTSLVRSALDYQFLSPPGQPVENP